MRDIFLPVRTGVARLRGNISGLFQDRSGASAVEFALIAPILVGGLLSMVDFGLAMTERMNLDYVLRAGANAAMAEQSQDHILKVLEVTASEQFGVADGSVGTNVAGAAFFRIRYLCSGTGTEPWEECATGPGATQGHVAYHLSAEKSYKGIFLRGLPLKAEIEVLVR